MRGDEEEIFLFLNLLEKRTLCFKSHPIEVAILVEILIQVRQKE